MSKIKLYKCKNEIALIPCMDFKDGNPFYYLRMSTDNTFGFPLKKEFGTKEEVENYRDKVVQILNLEEIE